MGSRPLSAFLDQALREYRDKMTERILRRPLNKPWMKYREIAIIEEVLMAVRPTRALEWGTGYGTLHFSRLLPSASRWIAVEHDSLWADRIRSMEPPLRVSIFTVPAENAAWKEAGGDGSYAEFRTYVDFPAQFGDFEFILVDGRARSACLRRAHSLLAPGGVVVLHDANREFLREALDLFPEQAEFLDYRRWSGGLWMGAKGGALEDVMDLEKHRQLWRWYNSFGKGFRL